MRRLGKRGLKAGRPGRAAAACTAWRMGCGEGAGFKALPKISPLFLKSISLQQLHLIKRVGDDGNITRALMLKLTWSLCVEEAEKLRLTKRRRADFLLLSLVDLTWK